MPPAGSGAGADGERRPAAGDPGDPAGGQVDTASLQAALSAAEAKAAEHYDALLRAKAEADNARRRAQEDVAKAHKFGIENFAEAMLPVMDSLQAALADPTTDVAKLREGVELTRKQLQAALERNRLVALDPVGEKFDPHRHQAISTVPRRPRRRAEPRRDGAAAGLDAGRSGAAPGAGHRLELTVGGARRRPAHERPLKSEGNPPIAAATGRFGAFGASSRPRR